MINILILTLSLVFTGQVWAQKPNPISKVWVADNGDGTYKNPVLHADYSDPDAIRVGDDYYMVASSFNCIPGLPVLHSRDLVNWELISYALQKQPPFDVFDKVQHGNGVWAPCIRYHKNEFYIYYPSPLWDEDGKAYMVYAFAGSRAGVKSVIMISRMNPEGTILQGNSVMLLDGHKNQPTVEGPKFYKRNGYYYIFAPAGGVPTGWQMVMRSKNVFGPYETKIVLQTG